MFFFGFADELTKLAQDKYRISSKGSKVSFDAQGRPIFKRVAGPPPGWHASPPPTTTPKPPPQPKKPISFLGRLKSFFS